MDYYEFVPSVMLYQEVGRHYERSWLHGWYYSPGYPGIYFAPLYKEPQDHSIEVMDDTDGICVPSPMSPRVRAAKSVLMTIRRPRRLEAAGDSATPPGLRTHRLDRHPLRMGCRRLWPLLSSRP